MAWISNCILYSTVYPVRFFDDLLVIIIILYNYDNSLEEINKILLAVLAQLSESCFYTLVFYSDDTFFQPPGNIVWSEYIRP